MITKLELVNGKLRACSELGGYPMFYLDYEDSCLCPECATESYLNDDEIPQFKVKASSINWESLLYCDRCSAEIESAYGSNEDED